MNIPKILFQVATIIFAERLVLQGVDYCDRSSEKLRNSMETMLAIEQDSLDLHSILSAIIISGNYVSVKNTHTAQIADMLTALRQGKCDDISFEVSKLSESVMHVKHQVRLTQLSVSK
uniref:Uncharacterized protein n=1 Tax=Romanomermis culicivorax TaxID=13658 RepID=A0A915L1H1_ROMCU